MSGWKLESQEYFDETGKPVETNKPIVTEEIVDDGPTDVLDIDKKYPIQGEETELEIPDLVAPKGEVVETTTEYFSTLAFLAEKKILDLDEEAEYEDSEDGLRQALEDHLSKEKSKFEASLSPEEKEYLDFIRAGGKPAEYIESKVVIDYADMDLTDVQTQFNIVVDHLIAMGSEQDEAEDLAKSYLEANLLEKQATIAQKKLVDLTKKSYEQKVEALQKEKEAKIQEEARKKEDYKKTILSTRSIKGFEIKETEATKLHDFITKPDRKGETALQKANTEENQLAYAWLLMNGFDLESLKKQANSEATKKIKKSLTQYKDNMVKPKQASKYSEEAPDTLVLPWNLHRKV